MNDNGWKDKVFRVQFHLIGFATLYQWGVNFLLIKQGENKP